MGAVVMGVDKPRTQQTTFSIEWERVRELLPELG
jgi:hypothetical protein